MTHDENIPDTLRVPYSREPQALTVLRTEEQRQAFLDQVIADCQD